MTVQDRLREVLEDARRDFDEQLVRNRAAFEETYAGRLKEMKTQLEIKARVMDAKKVDISGGPHCGSQQAN